MDKLKQFLEQAQELDNNDALSKYRSRFHFPEINGHKALYFCGNSLGLQPSDTAAMVNKELEQWRDYGVEGHFTGTMPWLSYHKKVSQLSAPLVGALPEETIVMNSLTANLHFLLCSFYQPQGKKRKIVMEKSAFPSDTYAIKSQLRFHGADENDDLILISPNDQYYYNNQDFISTIEQQHEEIALVLISGVHYLNGQLFDIENIARVCQKYNIPFGVDLAHAAGNVALQLHDWGVDFAVWCSYKYLNSGPGGVGGAFIHQKHHNNPSLPRLEGWWSNKETTRFEMNADIDPYPTAEAWQVSNAPVLSMAANLASLHLFHKVGMPALIEKSRLLTAYLRELLTFIAQKKPLTILTPSHSSEHGAQVSITFPNLAADFPEKLRNAGIIADYRNLGDNKGLIRLAPVPFYNSFMDVYLMVQRLNTLL